MSRVSRSAVALACALLVSAFTATGASAVDFGNTVAGGNAFTCAVETTGVIKCWGTNSNGQLGRGEPDGSNFPAGAVENLGGLARSIAAGGSHACAILNSGALKCWGQNVYRQLGDGDSTSSRTQPFQIPGLTSGVTDVATAANSTCAVVSGEVKCWGNNTNGQLGRGTVGGTSAVPTTVVGLGVGVKGLAAGQNHYCAITASNQVKCWGSNEYGQLGNGQDGQGAENNDKSVPTDIVGFNDVVQLSARVNNTCAITSNGALYCWGDGSSGQLGHGQSGPAGLRNTPSTVFTSDVVRVGVGGATTCDVMGGGVRCWGRDADGELGDGTASGSVTVLPPVTPNSLLLIAGVTGVALGSSHGCALFATGSLMCWGYNFSGQIGTTTEASSAPTPTVVPGLGEVAQFGQLADHTPPPAPMILQPAANAVVTTTTPTISGTAEPLSSVSVKLDGAALGVVTADASGNWSIQVATPLAVGVHSASATATDANENTSAESAQRGFIVRLPVKVSSWRLRQILQGKKSRGKLKTVIEYRQALPGGTDVFAACTGKVAISVKPKGVRKTIKVSAKFKTYGAGCVAKTTFKLPLKSKKKKLKFTVTAPGNEFVLPFKGTRTLKIR